MRLEEKLEELEELEETVAKAMEGAQSLARGVAASNAKALLDEALRHLAGAYRAIAAATDLAQSYSPNERWTRAYIDRLPDDAFLYVDKSRAEFMDDRGRSHPLDCRHLPVKNHLGNYDCAHIANAIARAPQADIPASAVKAAQRKGRALLDKHCH